MASLILEALQRETFFAASTAVLRVALGEVSRFTSGKIDRNPSDF